MSESAKIILCGKPMTGLIQEILSIKYWDGGKNYPIIVSATEEGPCIMDSIENVENALNGNGNGIDIMDYIHDKLPIKNHILKTGGNDELHYVEDSILYLGDGKISKIRNKQTHLTPKKKKRKKRR